MVAGMAASGSPSGYIRTSNPNCLTPDVLAQVLRTVFILNTRSRFFAKLKAFQFSMERRHVLNFSGLKRKARTSEVSTWFRRLLPSPAQPQS